MTPLPPMDRLTTLTRRQAESILLAKRPHHPDCCRNQTGMWDRSGICERCNAFVARADAMFGKGAGQ